jgi:hypothetical protein
VCEQSAPCPFPVFVSIPVTLCAKGPIPLGFPLSLCVISSGTGTRVIRWRHDAFNTNMNIATNAA